MKIVNSEHKLPPQALFLQCIQPSYLLVFTIFFIFYFIPEWWYIPPVVLVLVLLTQYIRYKRISYRFTNTKIYVLIDKPIEIEIHAISKLTIHQTFLQKKLNVTTLYMTCEDKVIKLPNILLAHARAIESIFISRKEVDDEQIHPIIDE